MKPQLVRLKAQESLLEDPSDPSPCNHGKSRYRYSKKGFGCLKFVIVDVDQSGTAEFAEQEVGEVCWYPFRPSVAERTAFHIAILTEAPKAGWPLLDFFQEK